ncbi:MAG: thermonuclease family protein [Coriobacteriia bacterium]|nr:thermonuclease family protein [Coriobacteriia bacterium]
MRNSKKKSVLSTRALVCMLAVAAVLTLAVAYELLWKDSESQEFEQARVVRIVDGDTLIVSIFGVNERVRLIGIDAPESVHSDETKNTQEGIDSSNYVKSIVQPGQTVYLQRDLSNRDKHERLLRYVWLEVPDDPWSMSEVRTKMLNGMLVDNAHAETRRYEPDTAYHDIFKAIAQAR